MSEKKELNQEQLRNVSGGTTTKKGKTIYTIDEAWELPNGTWVQVYDKNSMSDLGCWPIVNRYELDGMKVVVAERGNIRAYEMAEIFPYVFGPKL